MQIQRVDATGYNRFDDLDVIVFDDGIYKRSALTKLYWMKSITAKITNFAYLRLPLQEGKPATDYMQKIQELKLRHDQPVVGVRPWKDKK